VASHSSLDDGVKHLEGKFYSVDSVRKAEYEATGAASEFETAKHDAALTIADSTKVEVALGCAQMFVSDPRTPARLSAGAVRLGQDAAEPGRGNGRAVDRRRTPR
jgi:hypothetical protein